MRTARTGDGPVEHLTLELMVPDGADEHSTAQRAVDTLFTLTDGWMEILGLELRIACCDRENSIQHADISPSRPYHLLVREPRSADLHIGPTYQAVRVGMAEINRKAVHAFVQQVLSQTCADPARYEPCLGDLAVRASRVPLPSAWADNDVLSLDCYAGTVPISVERRDGQALLAAPLARYLVHQPVALSLTNFNGWLDLSVDVYWSPWEGELARSGSPLFEGVARLEANGWNRTSPAAV